MTEKYEFQALQAKWHPIWNEKNLYRTSEDKGKPKFYCLDFFPYPSGNGLSVGHLRNYVPTDVVVRMKRMQGFNVLHPMGWDAFGLPAENFAIQQGVHPSITTAKNAANYRRQLTLVECSYDWSREVNSTDPKYYKWTQWLFLLLHKRGLAYQSLGAQWWCPSCKTILANEQVEQGTCWRCESEVTKKDLKQWYFKITDYADRLLEDLQTIDWPDKIKKMQENWIGKRVGTEVTFKAEHPTQAGKTFDFSIFTTRVDTIFGVTFMTLAPEHPLVADLTHPDRKAEVERYVNESRKKSEIDRLATDKEKTGCALGSFAINPFNGERVPVFVGDYVLVSYGTGAV
ncbi:MAG TPA: class I tRNA ligase family protein, partial [Candidatus Ozemobacteraceae bacterium]|nr:class I tRNA ligase family protein [Candidatus Ozemobacteraceae bacterium]